MVEEQLVRRNVRDARVLDAMRRVPRHRFVPGAVAADAYTDGPLPIVGGQTISQPNIVAFMSEAARIEPGERCLEIGTGSGYQAAVLAELCKETFSIEYLPEVAELGRRNLRALGYLERAVSLRVGDGYAGWPEQAPFDAILVTAAPDQVPPPLLAQLALGGRLIIPVGEAGSQRLEAWTRRARATQNRRSSAAPNWASSSCRCSVRTPSDGRPLVARAPDTHVSNLQCAPCSSISRALSRKDSP